MDKPFRLNYSFYRIKQDLVPLFDLGNRPMVIGSIKNIEHYRGDLNSVLVWYSNGSMKPDVNQFNHIFLDI